MTSLASSAAVGVAARAGRAGRRDDHDVVRLDEAGPQQGRQADGHCGGVATGVGDARRAAQRGAGSRQLGQAVGPGPRVGAGVVRRPGCGVGEPEVGTEVDDRQVGGQLGHQSRRLAVRQGEEDEVGLRQRCGVGRDEAGVGEGGQLRVDAGDRLAGLGVGRDRSEPQLGMSEDEAQQLATRVATRPGNRRRRTHVHDYAGRTHGHANEYPPIGPQLSGLARWI